MPDGSERLVGYRSLASDSARWEAFEFRPGDIVISTPPKSGTTWTQMLVALLIFGDNPFPAPLNEMSPWIDLLVRPIESVREALHQQRHRRFVKTHTPLDGVPVDERATYIVVGRNPMDIAMSWRHHMKHLDVARFLQRRAEVVGSHEIPDLSGFDDPAEELRYFIDASPVPSPPPTLANVLHHFDTGWQRRHLPNVAMFHYLDLLADLPEELRRLGATLDIDLTDAEAGALAQSASLERMRRDAASVVPNASDGLWPAPELFFRSGGSGGWETLLTQADLSHYDARMRSLITEDLADWVHNGRHVHTEA